MVYHEGDDPEEHADEGAEAGATDAASWNELPPEEDDDELDALDDDEPDERAPGGRRRRLERMLPEALKRAIEKGLETGIGTLTNSSEALRGVVNKAEIPKEVAHYVFGQVDDTRNAMVRVVAREVREFLQKADLAKELQRALTSLSFEIRTEIRFIPNEAGGVTPDVKAKVGPRRGSEEAKRRRGRRPSALEDDEESEDTDD